MSNGFHSGRRLSAPSVDRSGARAPGPAHRLLACRFTSAVAGSDPAVGTAILDDLAKLEPSDVLAVLAAMATNLCLLLQRADPDGWRDGLAESVARLTIESEA